MRQLRIPFVGRTPGAPMVAGRANARWAAPVVGAYVLVVIGSLAYFIVDLTLVAHEDASLAGVWPILATAPLGLILPGLVGDILINLGVRQPLALILFVLTLMLCGALQAWLLWLILRGRKGTGGQLDGVA